MGEGECKSHEKQLYKNKSLKLAGRSIWQSTAREKNINNSEKHGLAKMNIESKNIRDDGTGKIVKKEIST